MQKHLSRQVFLCFKKLMSVFVFLKANLLTFKYKKGILILILFVNLKGIRNEDFRKTSR